MYKLLCDLLAQGVNEAFTLLDQAMSDLLHSMLNVEDMVVVPGSTIMTTGSLAELYQFIYIAVCGIVVLKFLFKGFKIYVLWRDGDADTSPATMLTGAGAAAFMMVAFPLLYKYMAAFTVFLAEGIMARLGEYETLKIQLLPAPELLGQTLVALLILLVYIIFLIVLWVRLLGRGVELLVLRLGVPVSCLGLLDSDGGLFRGYMQIFFKTLFTSVIQIVLMAWSVRILSSLSMPNVLLGTAMVITALHTPTLMQQILIQSRVGGGLTSKISSGAMAVRGVMALFHR